MSVEAPVGDYEALRSLQDIIDHVNDREKDGVAHTGILKEALALGTTAVEVFHGLGRAPKFAVAVLLSANATVFVSTDHVDPRNYVMLTASATVTASVLIA